MSGPQDFGSNEDRTMPAVCYGLYLVGLTHGLTIFITVVLAYASRGSAGPVMYSHYTWLIRTFWLSIVWFVIGVLLIVVGGVFSFVLIGIPFFVLGWIVCGGVWVWTLIRGIVGVIALSRDEPVMRPYALGF